MVAGMSRGKKNYLQYERELSDAIARLSTLREEFKAAIDADAASYEAVMKAYKAKSDRERWRDCRSSQGRDQRAPGRGRAGQGSGAIAEALRPITNPKMASDLAVAVALAQAALTGALANVEINLEDLNDAAFVGEVRSRSAALKG